MLNSVITPKHFFTLCLVYSLIDLLGGQLVFAEEQTNNTQEIIKQEISLYENPEILNKPLQHIDNEKNPEKKIKQISPWLRTNIKKTLTKNKQPYLWAKLHSQPTLL